MARTFSNALHDAAVNTATLQQEKDWGDWESRGQPQFFRSIRAGVEGMRGAFHGTSAVANRIIGRERKALEQEHKADLSQARASGMRGAVPTFGESDSLGDYATWATDAVGSNLPLIGSIIAGGGVAGAAAQGAARVGAKRAGRALAEQAAKKYARRGQLAGAAVPYGMTAVNENYSRIRHDPDADGTPRQQALGAAVGGAAQTALGLSAPNHLLNNLNRGRGLAGTAGVLAGTAALEGVTELGEQVIQRGTHKLFNEDVNLFDPDARAEYLEALAAGTLVGGVYALPTLTADYFSSESRDIRERTKAAKERGLGRFDLTQPADPEQQQVQYQQNLRESLTQQMQQTADPRRRESLAVELERLYLTEKWRQQVDPMYLYNPRESQLAPEETVPAGEEFYNGEAAEAPLREQLFSEISNEWVKNNQTAALQNTRAVGDPIHLTMDYEAGGEKKQDTIFIPPDVRDDGFWMETDGQMVHLSDYQMREFLLRNLNDFAHPAKREELFATAHRARLYGNEQVMRNKRGEDPYSETVFTFTPKVEKNKDGTVTPTDEILTDLGRERQRVFQMAEQALMQRYGDDPKAFQAALANFQSRFDQGIQRGQSNPLIVRRTPQRAKPLPHAKKYGLEVARIDIAKGSPFDTTTQWKTAVAGLIDHFRHPTGPNAEPKQLVAAGKHQFHFATPENAKRMFDEQGVKYIEDTWVDRNGQQHTQYVPKDVPDVKRLMTFNREGYAMQPFPMRDQTGNTLPTFRNDARDGQAGAFTQGPLGGVQQGNAQVRLVQRDAEGNIVNERWAYSKGKEARQTVKLKGPTDRDWVRETPAFNQDFQLQSDIPMDEQGNLLDGWELDTEAGMRWDATKDSDQSDPHGLSLQMMISSAMNNPDVFDAFTQAMENGDLTDLMTPQERRWFEMGVPANVFLSSPEFQKKIGQFMVAGSRGYAIPSDLVPETSQVSIEDFFEGWKNRAYEQLQQPLDPKDPNKTFWHLKENAPFREEAFRAVDAMEAKARAEGRKLPGTRMELAQKYAISKYFDRLRETFGLGDEAPPQTYLMPETIKTIERRSGTKLIPGVSMVMVAREPALPDGSGMRGYLYMGEAQFDTDNLSPIYQKAASRRGAVVSPAESRVMEAMGLDFDGDNVMVFSPAEPFKHRGFKPLPGSDPQQFVVSKKPFADYFGGEKQWMKMQDKLFSSIFAEWDGFYDKIGMAATYGNRLHEAELSTQQLEAEMKAAIQAVISDQKKSADKAGAERALQGAKDVAQDARNGRRMIGQAYLGDRQGTANKLRELATKAKLHTQDYQKMVAEPLRNLFIAQEAYKDAYAKVGSVEAAREELTELHTAATIVSNQIDLLRKEIVDTKTKAGREFIKYLDETVTELPPFMVDAFRTLSGREQKEVRYRDGDEWRSFQKSEKDSYGKRKDNFEEFVKLAERRLEMPQSETEAALARRALAVASLNAQAGDLLGAHKLTFPTNIRERARDLSLQRLNEGKLSADAKRVLEKLHKDNADLALKEHNQREELLDRGADELTAREAFLMGPERKAVLDQAELLYRTGVVNEVDMLAWGPATGLVDKLDTKKLQEMLANEHGTFTYQLALAAPKKDEAFDSNKHAAVMDSTTGEWQSMPAEGIPNGQYRIHEPENQNPKNGYIDFVSTEGGPVFRVRVIDATRGKLQVAVRDKKKRPRADAVFSIEKYVGEKGVSARSYNITPLGRETTKEEQAADEATDALSDEEQARLIAALEGQAEPAAPAPEASAPEAPAPEAPAPAPAAEPARAQSQKPTLEERDKQRAEAHYQKMKAREAQPKYKEEFLPKVNLAIKTFSKPLGMEAPTFLSVDEARAIVEQRPGDLVHQLGQGFYDKATNSIFVDPALKLPEFTAVLGHELGHAVLHKVLGDNLSDSNNATGRELLADYYRWARSHGVKFDSIVPGLFGEKVASSASGTSTIQDVMNSKRAGRLQDVVKGKTKISELNPTELMDLFNFSEWFADQTGRWLDNRLQPQTKTDAFFRNIADAFKRLFHTMKEKLGYPPAPSVEKFYSSVLEGYFFDKRQWIEQDAKAKLPPAKQELVDWYEAGVQQGRFNIEGAAQAIRGYIDRTLSAEDIKILRREAMHENGQVQMQDLLRNDLKALQDLRHSPDAALSYYVALVRAGMVEPGATGKNIIAKFGRAMRKIGAQLTGFEQEIDRLDAIAAAISGRDTFSSQDIVLPSRKRSKLQEKITEALASAYQPVLQAYNYHLEDMAKRAEETRNSKIIQIQRMLHRPKHNASGHQTGLLEGVRYHSGRFMEMAELAIGEFVTDKTYAREITKKAMLQALLKDRVQKFNKKEDVDQLSKLEQTITPADQKHINKFRALFKRVGDYAVDKKSMLKEDTRQDYLPWLFDLERLATDKASLIELAEAPNFKQAWEKMALNWMIKGRFPTPPDFSERSAQAQQAYVRKKLPEFIRHRIDQLDREGVQHMVLDEAHKPGFRFSNPRDLDFLMFDGTEQQREALLSFLDLNPAQMTYRYIHSAVKRSEFAERFGKNGETLAQLIEEAREEGATPAQLRMIVDNVDMIQGMYGARTKEQLNKLFSELPLPQIFKDSLIDKSSGTAHSAVKNTTGWWMVYEIFRILPLSALSSFIDLAGAGAHSGSMTAMIRAQYKTAMRTFGAMDKARAEALLETLNHAGTIDRASMHQIIQAEIHSMHMPRIPKMMAEAFFNYNGIEFVTRKSREISTYGSFEFLLTHAKQAKAGDKRSIRYMNDYGVSPDDIVAHGKYNDILKLLSPKERQALLEKGDKASLAELDRDDRIKLAVHEIVNASTIRPGPDLRSQSANDPNLAGFWFIRNFMLLFSGTFLNRVSTELFQHGNPWPMMTMVASFLPIMLMADWLRDYIKYGEEGAPWKSRWTMGQHIEYAVGRAGFYGKTDIWGEVTDPLFSGDIPHAMAEFVGVGGTHFERIMKRGLSERELPLYGLWGNWN